jgi:hypothetical protein
LAYRDAVEQKRNVAVVDHRPRSLIVVIALTAMFWLFASVTFWQAAVYSRSVQLTCNERECTVLRTYVALDTRDTFARDQVRAVVVTSHRGKSSTTYGVAIHTANGRVLALIRPGRNKEAVEIQQAVVDVIEKRTGGRQLEALSLWSLCLFVFGAGLFAMPLAFTARARLEFDFDRGEVRHTLHRWPRRRQDRVFDARKVSAARVRARTGQRGEMIYELMLDEVSVAGSGGGEKRNAVAARQINEYLERMRELEG